MADLALLDTAMLPLSQLGHIQVCPPGGSGGPRVGGSSFLPSAVAMVFGWALLSPLRQRAKNGDLLTACLKHYEHTIDCSSHAEELGRNAGLRTNDPQLFGMRSRTFQRWLPRSSRWQHQTAWLRGQEETHPQPQRHLLLPLRLQLSPHPNLLRNARLLQPRFR